MALTSPSEDSQTDFCRKQGYGYEEVDLDNFENCFFSSDSSYSTCHENKHRNKGDRPVGTDDNSKLIDSIQEAKAKEYQKEQKNSQQKGKIKDKETKKRNIITTTLIQTLIKLDLTH